MSRKIDINLGFMNLTGTSSETCLHLNDSYKVKSSTVMYNVLHYIKYFSEPDELMSHLSLKKALWEWKAHNLLYNLHIFRNHTADVDINDNNWIMNIGYFILSLLYWK